MTCYTFIDRLWCLKLMHFLFIYTVFSPSISIAISYFLCQFHWWVSFVSRPITHWFQVSLITIYIICIMAVTTGTKPWIPADQFQSGELDMRLIDCCLQTFIILVISNTVHSIATVVTANADQCLVVLAWHRHMDMKCVLRYSCGHQHSLLRLVHQPILQKHHCFASWR